MTRQRDTGRTIEPPENTEGSLGKVKPQILPLDSWMNLK